ncbi:hypothetical protein AGDE_05932 [Angomonas deanei]|nr:hypothetical protein AGDE_05932 [Angomonas deanei]|eukprot:EPY38001.1 hypothetical protein AGDE_05932 [Angomonas deanei]
MPAESSPCEIESTLWRECLKQFDYGPDRPKNACEGQRNKYYGCIKTWTKETQQREYSYKDYELSEECSHEADRLHQCMMINMFEVSRCQNEMTLLKRCGAKHHPEIQKALTGDVALHNLENSVDASTGWRRLWYKADW